jgi:hypothetical protein
VTLLSEVIAAAGPWLAAYAAAEPGPGRFDGSETDPNRLFVLEAVHQGYLMHYGKPSAFRALDQDLLLLAGDSLYALGLSRLAEVGDLEAVAELGDLISLTAQAHAEGRPELADELWEVSARALSRGGGPGVREALGGRLPAARLPERL